MNRVLAVLEPDSPENPWDDLGLRLRNRLVIHLLYSLGIRRDEALGIKITDHVQWQQDRILIARRHQFLLVAHDTGKPLSDVAFSKIFVCLRVRVTDLPKSLTGHVLRHAWNAAFSRLIDEKNVSPEREAQMRSAAMGWSPGSGMAAT